MPAPQFMKQISAERNFTTPGTLLRLDPEATSVGATHLMVLGNDEFGNVILLPGHSRSDLLSASGDVHCWVLPQEELESLEPTYDGRIPDHLRLVSVEAQQVEVGQTVYLTRKERNDQTKAFGSYFFPGRALQVEEVGINPHTTNRGAKVTDPEVGAWFWMDLILLTPIAPQFRPLTVRS